MDYSLSSFFLDQGQSHSEKLNINETLLAWLAIQIPLLYGIAFRGNECVYIVYMYVNTVSDE